LNDPDIPLVIVEGTKQYLAAVTELTDKQFCPVGLNGIRGWQWKPDGEGTRSKPLPDWRYIPLVGRKVYVIPDGDYATKDGVREGTDDLTAWLTLQGADTARVTVPLIGGQESTGLDDYFEQTAPEKCAQELLRLFEEADDQTDGFFLGWDDLMDLPPVQPLIDGMLNQASIVWLSGKFGTYKTFLALAWACSVATGQPWEGHRVAKSGPVIYVAAEGHQGLKGRALGWSSRFNKGKPVRNLITTPKGLDPRKPGDMARLVRQIRKTGAVMVVFDTLHRCAPGMEENSNKDLGEAFGALQKLKDETGVTVLVLHHTGYSGEHARGASSQEDDADDAYIIKLGYDGKSEDRSPLTARILKRSKSKEGEAGEEFPLKLVTIEGNKFDRATGNAYITLPDPAEAFLDGPRETNVERIVREMDDAGLPVDFGRDAAKGWLTNQGVNIRGKGTDFAVALKARKMRNES
jgi:hypothetical protein